MVLKTARLAIDRSMLPQKWDDLGIRFERHSVTKIKTASPPSDMMLIKPAGALLSAEDAVGPEPRWNSILCGMHLKAVGGTEVQGGGQLVITAQRLIGMIDSEMTSGGRPLSAATAGSVFCFTCNRDDLCPVQVKKHRLTPSDFSFRSREGQSVAFQLRVIASAVYVANNKMGYWHDKNMLHSLSEEGRKGLLRT